MRRSIAALAVVVVACAASRRRAPSGSAQPGVLRLDDCAPSKGVLCEPPPIATTNSASATAVEAPILASPAPSMCARLSGQGVVGSGGAASPVATTEAACQQCSGSWGPHGMLGIVGCLCGTPDGGRPCSSPHDCASECLVMDADAEKLVPRCPVLGAKLPGVCAYAYVVFGCHAYVVEKSTPSGPLRQVWRVCRD
jgi:hypothetical protein